MLSAFLILLLFSSGIFAKPFAQYSSNDLIATDIADIGNDEHPSDVETPKDPNIANMKNDNNPTDVGASKYADNIIISETGDLEEPTGSAHPICDTISSNLVTCGGPEVVSSNGQQYNMLLNCVRGEFVQTFSIVKIWIRSTANTVSHRIGNIYSQTGKISDNLRSSWIML